MWAIAQLVQILILKVCLAFSTLVVSVHSTFIDETTKIVLLFYPFLSTNFFCHHSCLEFSITFNICTMLPESVFLILYLC